MHTSWKYFRNPNPLLAPLLASMQPLSLPCLSSYQVPHMHVVFSNVYFKTYCQCQRISPAAIIRSYSSVGFQQETLSGGSTHPSSDQPCRAYRHAVRVTSPNILYCCLYPYQEWWRNIGREWGTRMCYVFLSCC